MISLAANLARADDGIFFDERIHQKPRLIKVMTLNVGHARGKGRHQILQSVTQTKDHLWNIVNVLKREQPHVVAFQEIDRNSFWNGRFDHAEFVADGAEFPHHFGGYHIDGNRLSYGAALVGRLSFKDTLSVPFTRPFGRLRKGFVVSTVHWPGHDDVEVDLVSVHFDPVTKRRRNKEAAQLIETLESRDNPKVLMGDFNSEYVDSALIPMLEERLGLYTWQPHEELATFPKFNKRWDWVLVSPEIEIVSHEVLPDHVSDHRAIIAELRLIGG